MAGNDFHRLSPTASDSRAEMISPSNMVLGSFIGDALALGPHWIYDQAAIRNRFGKAQCYHPPISAYHPGKSAGDLTHYGDQTLVLLRSIAENGGFGLAHFSASWRDFWENSATISYRDGATKSTLAHLQSGAPASTSQDIAGAARIAPLFLLKWDDDDALLAAVRAQTRFTHGDPSVIEAAEFFTRVVFALRRGSGMQDAMENTMKLRWNSLAADGFENAVESAASPEADSTELHRHGLSCHTEDALPAICHLLLRHWEDPATALIENTSAGGDSAARGMLLGLVYGAAFPVSGWPAQWTKDLHALPEINRLIQQLS